MAGNARFHDKFHRKNHHTNPTVGFTDSATDPIASPSEPFQGDFSLNGKLSTSFGIDILSANIKHDLYCENVHVTDVTYTNYISGNSTEAIISDGSLVGNGNNTLTLDFQTGIYAKTPSYNISNRLSVAGFSKLSGVNINDVVYLSHPTYGSVDNLVQDATLTVRSSSDFPVNIITSDDSNTNNIRNYKSRGTLVSKTYVSANDKIFGIEGYAHNGTDYNYIAGIAASSEGDQTTSNGGGYLTLHTSPSSTVNSLSERVRITGFGNVGIGELGSKTGSTSATVEIAAGPYGGPSTVSEYNGRALSLLGGRSNRVFTQFYANSAAQTERSGWIGYGSTVNRDLTINNELSASLDLKTQNTSRLFITSAGDIGINSTTPDVKLDVYGTIAGSTLVGRATGAGTDETSLFLTRSGAITNQKTWQSIHLNSGIFKIRTVDDAYSTEDDAFVATRLDSGIGINSISLGTNFNTRLHIISSGEIGLGTINPKGDVHIKNATDPNYASIVLGSNTDDGFHITNETNGGGLGIWTGIKGSGVSRLHILTGGNVGIGTNNPAQKLHVEGNIYTNGNIRATGDLFIEGSLSALGDISIIDTNIISTSSLSVINHGTTEALLINQIGNYPIARFQQDGTDSLVIKGTNVTVYNTLTAKDYISSPNINLLQSTSSNWDSVYTTVSTNSSQWMTGGDTVDYRLRNLTINQTVSTTNIRVVNSMYLPVSTGMVVSAFDTQLEVNSPTYLFMDTDGFSSVNMKMPSVDSTHMGLVFYIKNIYGGSEPNSKIKIKTYLNSELYEINKLGQTPNLIQLIWDGFSWQQILLV